MDTPNHIKIEYNTWYKRVMQMLGFIDVHPRGMKICITNTNIWKFIIELTLAKMCNVNQSVNV